MKSALRPDIVFLNYCYSALALPKLRNFVRLGWPGQIGDDRAASAATALFQTLDTQSLGAAIRHVMVDIDPNLSVEFYEARPREDLIDAWSLGCLAAKQEILNAPAETIRWHLGLSDASVWPCDTTRAQRHHASDLRELLCRFDIPLDTCSFAAIHRRLAEFGNADLLAAFNLGVHLENLFLALLILKNAYRTGDADFQAQAYRKANGIWLKLSTDLKKFLPDQKVQNWV